MGAIKSMEQFANGITDWSAEEFELNAPAIAQDYWHLKGRVTGELSKTHPDRALAIRELGDICRLIQDGSLRRAVEADYKSRWDADETLKRRPFQGRLIKHCYVSCVSIEY